LARHFLTGAELTSAELERLLERAIELKAERAGRAAGGHGAGAPPSGAALADRGPLAGRSVALVFDQPSTRTRVSFEVGVHELGGHPVVLREGELQLSRGESPRDTALVLSRMVAAIGVRTGPHETVEQLAEHARIPVINMLTRDHHPCQALADLMTLRERFGRLEGLKLAYVGDGNNVARSLTIAAPLAGVELALATPEELSLPEAEPVSVNEAVNGAHAVYTDVWFSMGDDEAEADRKRELLEPYRLDEDLLAHARDDAVALHCLPAHPGDEISGGVLYGERSAVWDQAENRLHAQKALLEHLLFDTADPRRTR
jgi:ornithine carbamoyltransferase